MAVASITINEARDDVIDFTYPFYFDKTAILYRVPTQNTDIMGFITRPFQWQVWLCIAFCVPLLSIAVYFLMKINKSIVTSQRKEKENDRSILTAEFSVVVMQLYGALLTQGNHGNVLI